jgi:hypothetical protein
MLLNSFYRILGVVWGVRGGGGAIWDREHMTGNRHQYSSWVGRQLATTSEISDFFFNLSLRCRKYLLNGDVLYVEFVMVLFSFNSQ